MVTELESAIHERKKNTEDEVDGITEEIVSGDDDGLEEKALEVVFESVLCRAPSSENVSSRVCDQLRFKPACSATETS